MRLKRIIILLLIVLVGIGAVVFFFASGGTALTGNDPKSLVKYLGVTMPASVHDIKVQYVSSETVHLIAKFQISKIDLEKLASELQLVKTDDALASVTPLPLLGTAAENPWWNPPGLSRQWNLKDRYRSAALAKDDLIAIIWIDGTAYLYKSGPY